MKSSYRCTSSGGRYGDSPVPVLGYGRKPGKQYGEFRGAAAGGDTTPEVFLLTGLPDMKEFERAQTVLERLRARVSSSPALSVLISHFGPLVKKETAGQ
jgi:hypothetical protein